ncbi:unnamed protein product [Spirodela intermedia]|uniref:DOG1 domain-containing protein n=1 Tax=Spirodela intermedia TaxID=51605 RepID=A0A7I8L2Z9_SPIIN|nr:unnamed protein product [Spirodela intermedia]
MSGRLSLLPPSSCSSSSSSSPPSSPSSSFGAPDGSDCFGELDEDFIQGVVPMRPDADGKPPPPPTLEIFPSWPMRLPQPSWVRPSSPPPDSDVVHQPQTLRRLAQNREAARKSRLRKKAYVRQLETCRLKLAQMEQDLQRARSQGLFSGSGVSPGAAIFDMEYARWLDEDRKLMSELGTGLRGQLADDDLRVVVDECLAHHDEIFQLKAAAASSDVFHIITGMWASPAERCFLWMGGFRPSEILKMLIPQLDPLTEQQLAWICSLQESSQQAEEALSQGLEQLQQSLTDTVASGPLNDGANVGDYMAQMTLALGKLYNLEGFVHQADNLRQQTLQQMRKILTVRQAARCFLAVGEYHARLRSLGSLWASRPLTE